MGIIIDNQLAEPLGRAAKKIRKLAAKNDRRFGLFKIP